VCEGGVGCSEYRRVRGDDDEYEEGPSDVRAQLRRALRFIGRAARELEPREAKAVAPLHEDDAALLPSCIRLRPIIKPVVAPVVAAEPYVEERHHDRGAEDQYPSSARQRPSELRRLRRPGLVELWPFHPEVVCVRVEGRAESRDLAALVCHPEVGRAHVCHAQANVPDGGRPSGVGEDVARRVGRVGEAERHVGFVVTAAHDRAQVADDRTLEGHAVIVVERAAAIGHDGAVGRALKVHRVVESGDDDAEWMVH